MKKLLKSRLCVLAMGTTFFANSDAARWSRLPGGMVAQSIILNDEYDKISSIGVPTTPLVMIDTIKGFKLLYVEGSTFKLYFLNGQTPQNIPLISLEQLPLDLKNQVIDILDGNEVDPINKFYDKLMSANIVHSKQKQLLGKINLSKQKLETLAAKLNNRINSNLDIKGIIAVILDESEGIKNVELIENVQNPSNFLLQFNVPAQSTEMKDEIYYQNLKELCEQWSSLDQALNQLPPSVFPQVPPQ